MFPTGCADEILSFALKLDKPVMLDYYESSIEKGCKIVKNGDDKLLFKSNEEHTSPILKVLKVPTTDNSPPTHLICETQNSLYVVHCKMLQK